MQSSMWHTLLVLSSIKDILKYYRGNGTVSEDLFIINRMFPKNMEHLDIEPHVGDTIGRIRNIEKKNSEYERVEVATLIGLYTSLESYFTSLFYEELNNGLPEDVQELITSDEPSLENLKETLKTLLQ